MFASDTAFSQLRKEMDDSSDDNCSSNHSNNIDWITDSQRHGTSTNIQSLLTPPLPPQKELEVSQLRQTETLSQMFEGQQMHPNQKEGKAETPEIFFPQTNLFIPDDNFDCDVLGQSSDQEMNSQHSEGTNTDKSDGSKEVNDDSTQENEFEDSPQSAVAASVQHVIEAKSAWTMVTRGKKTANTRFYELPENQEDEVEGDTISESTLIRKSVWFNPQADYNATRDDVEQEEDDINTIASDQTSHFNKKTEANKQVPPRCVRYQVSFVLSDVDNELLAQEFKGNEVTDNQLCTLSRVRKVMIDFYTQMRKVDPDSLIISWKEENTFQVINEDPNLMPDDPVSFSSFFQGFRPKVKNGKIFLRVRIHSKLSDQKVLDKMDVWCLLHEIRFNPCIIQSEHSSIAGWILYSSQYTDVSFLAQYLEARSGSEWGFKVGPVTKSDSTEDYRERVKALLVYLPTEKVEVAESTLSRIFEINPNATVPVFTDRFIYMQPE